MTAESGFDAFFAAHHANMVRALTIVLGDPERGRDAAAEGFTRAFAGWAKIGQHENPAGWVYRVGLNSSRSRWRKRSREVAGPTFDRADPSPRVARDFTVIDAVRSLSADHRAVVVGRYYLDWTEAQLAAALDVAPGTVKSRLSRALENLERTLEQSP